MLLEIMLCIVPEMCLTSLISEITRPCFIGHAATSVVLNTHIQHFNIQPNDAPSDCIISLLSGQKPRISIFHLFTIN